jgi:2,3-bisphosphoglycerate-independent phosphoglycerate mutase
MAARKPVLLIILDGWGNRQERADNAVALAATPTVSRLLATCPVAALEASGRDVGLPSGQIGNSEVGHLNIGAGRVVMQELPRIDAAIEDGGIWSTPAFRGLVAALKASGGICHLDGLVSPGGVHSHTRHAVAIAHALVREGIAVALHAVTDGRDTPPRSAAAYLDDLSADLPAGVTIATVSGRFFAMDRDNRWERVEPAYRTRVAAAGVRFASAAAVVADAYARNISDEFIEPSPVGDYAGMKDGDALVLFNFRADRMRELIAPFIDDNFSAFPTGTRPKLAAIVTMTRYQADLGAARALFDPQSMNNTLGEVVAAAGLRQLRMAETEKYPHVTYFLNGGREAPYPGETRVLVPSPKVKTYDLMPEMSARPLTERALAALAAGEHDLIVINFANPDMVGHTGSLPAAIKAVETVDECLGRILDALALQGGSALVIADHGNCELMRDPETGEPHTAHTTNPVPVILVGAGQPRLRDGRLADVAPTVLALLDVPIPADMTGRSLID